jgi:hypothetical protein
VANDLVISVGASIRDLERQMKAASQVAAKRAEEIENEFRRRNPSLAGDFGLGVLKGAIAGLAFDKITREMMSANKEIASFGDSAKRAGIDLARFQELRLAAQGQGIEGKAFDAGIQGLAKSLNEARREETELTKLLDANGVKYKNRKGEIVSTNEALAIAADLISRAATEQDKIALAERFGLPADFVPLLEGGAAALQKLARDAGEAGTILDSDVIAKAKQFDVAWETGWASFASNSKAAIVAAGIGLSGLIASAGDYLKTVNAANIAQSQSAERRARRDQALDMSLGNAGGRAAQRAEEETATRKAVSNFRAAEIAYRNAVKEGQTLPPSRPPGLVVGKHAVIPAKQSGGGSSGGKSEDEQAQDRLDRYIEGLVRQRAVMEAEIATVGRSNAERKAAVEIAKAQVDLEKLSTSEKASYIARLTEEVGKNEEVRASKERLEKAQKGLNDAQTYFGNAAVDALEDMIINGAKAEDVMKRLTASLAKAALQAALMGNGPLAGLFGTSGTNGAPGGLFGGIGALFGRATGGPVNAGQPYRVGERGPETFVPTTPGRILPAGRGGAPQVKVNVINNAGAQVSTGQGANGDISVLIDAAEARMGDRLARGQGALSAASRAVGSGRQLRG